MAPTDWTDATTVMERDDRLIDDGQGVVRDARRRAPQDFLFALSVVLGAIAAALLALGAVSGGLLHNRTLEEFERIATEAPLPPR